MGRGFLFLLLGGFAITFFATWHMAGPAEPPPPPVRIANGQMVVPKTCEEAEKLGVAPLMVGRPGYSRELDPDGDGLACPPTS